jgi:hypothetical protein
MPRMSLLGDHAVTFAEHGLPPRMEFDGARPRCCLAADAGATPAPIALRGTPVSVPRLSDTARRGVLEQE